MNTATRQVVGPLNQSGFTLIELLIVVVVIAILASIGYPSYTKYVERTRQAEAQGGMMELAGALERYRAKNFSYKDADGKLSTLAPSLSKSEYYKVTITVQGAGSQQYLLTAQPKGLMSDTEFMALNSEGQSCIKKSSCTIGTDPSWKDD